MAEADGKMAGFLGRARTVVRPVSKVKPLLTRCGTLLQYLPCVSISKCRVDSYGSLEKESSVRTVVLEYFVLAEISSRMTSIDFSTSRGRRAGSGLSLGHPGSRFRGLDNVNRAIASGQAATTKKALATRSKPSLESDFLSDFTSYIHPDHSNMSATMTTTEAAPQTAQATTSSTLATIELDGYDEEQIRLMEERCILVTPEDKAYGDVSKKTCECHLELSLDCSSVDEQHSPQATL